MKIIPLNTKAPLTTAEKLIVAVLKMNSNAFNATNKQFLRNNQAYFAGMPGMIA